MQWWQDKDPAAVLQPGRPEKQEKPALALLGSKHIASCQLQPLCCSRASSGAGRAAGEGLGEVAAVPMQTPRQPCHPAAVPAPRAGRA